MHFCEVEDLSRNLGGQQSTDPTVQTKKYSLFGHFDPVAFRRQPRQTEMSISQPASAACLFPPLVFTIFTVGENPLQNGGITRLFARHNSCLHLKDLSRQKLIPKGCERDNWFGYAKGYFVYLNVFNIFDYDIL